MVPKGVPLLPQVEARAPHGFILRYCPHSFRHWPLVPPQKAPSRMFPVTSGSRICATLRLRLSTRRNRQVAGLRILVDPGHNRAHRQLQATHRRVRQHILVWLGLAPVPLLFALPSSSCSDPTATAVVPARMLSSDISCRRTQNASVLHNHAHASGKTAGTAAAVLWVRRALRADRTLRRNSTRPFSSLTLSPLLTSSSSLNRKCV